MSKFGEAIDRSTGAVRTTSERLTHIGRAGLGGAIALEGFLYIMKFPGKDSTPGGLALIAGGLLAGHSITRLRGGYHASEDAAEAQESFVNPQAVALQAFEAMPPEITGTVEFVDVSDIA